MSAHIAPSGIGSTNYERVAVYAPEVLEPWLAIERAFFERSILPRKLPKQVRRALTLGHGCEYCRAKASPPDDPQGTLRTSLAAALAQPFIANHKSIVKAQINILGESFSAAELVGLAAFNSFMWLAVRSGRPSAFSRQYAGNTAAANSRADQAAAAVQCCRAMFSHLPAGLP